MERLVKNRLSWWLESRDILHRCQSGFRPGRSTKDCTLLLHDDIYKGIANKRSTLAVFIDIEKAYDTVWRNGLLYKLGSIGVTGNIFRWIRSFLYNRTFQVRVGSAMSEIHSFENGIPQGSVLSPLLFAIMINDLPENIGINVNLYADDACIWDTDLDINKLVSNVQSALNQVKKWCDNWGLRVSNSKSAGVLFSRRRKIPNICLRIDNDVLSMKREYKYLGLIFDSKLTYRSHVKCVTDRCHKRLNLLRLLSGTTWGASKPCLLTIYRTLIRPVMEYCFETYLFASNYVSESLQKIQNAALRVCCGAVQSTPVFALQHSCKEYPIHLRHLYACLKYKSYLLATENHPGRALVTQSWHEIFPDSASFRTFNMFTSVDLFRRCDHAIDSQSTDPPWLLLPVKIDLSLSRNPPDHPIEKRNQCIEYIHENYSSYTRIFTDGSKSDIGCGSAYWVENAGAYQKITLNHLCFVFTAELLAILESLIWSEINKCSKVAIFSDSLSSLQAIESRKMKHHLVRRIIGICSRLARTCQELVLVWSPSHVGIPGNERADSLAKEAAVSGQISVNMRLSRNEVEFLISSHCQDLWETYYANSGEESHYKTIWPDPCKPKEGNLSRKYSRILFRLETGHCRLNYHLHRIGCHPNGLCSECRIEETVEHFVLYCTKYTHYRQQLKETANQHCVSLAIPDLLRSPFTRNRIIEFVLATDRDI